VNDVEKKAMNTYPRRMMLGFSMLLAANPAFLFSQPDNSFKLLLLRCATLIKL